MKNKNLREKEYISIVSPQDLYSAKLDTTTSWAQKFCNNNIENDNQFIIYILFENEINKIFFTKNNLKDIGDIFNLVRIYFGQDYINLICKKNCRGINILKTIEQLPEIKNLIMEKLNLKKYDLKDVSIKEFKAFLEYINKIYSLEVPKTHSDLNSGETRMILKNIDTFIYPKTYINKKINNNINNSERCLNNNMMNNSNFSQINSNICMSNSDNNFQNRMVNNNFYNNMQFLNKNNNMFSNNFQNMGAIFMQNNMQINY